MYCSPTICCIVSICNHHFHVIVSWVLQTFSLITISTTQTCLWQMGGEDDGSLPCLLHLSTAAGGSSNPGIWERSPVHNFFYNSKICFPAYEVPLRDNFSQLSQVEEPKKGFRILRKGGEALSDYLLQLLTVLVHIYIMMWNFTKEKVAQPLS